MPDYAIIRVHRVRVQFESRAGIGVCVRVCVFLLPTRHAESALVWFSSEGVARRCSLSLLLSFYFSLSFSLSVDCGKCLLAHPANCHLGLLLSPHHRNHRARQLQFSAERVFMGLRFEKGPAMKCTSEIFKLHL